MDSLTLQRSDFLHRALMQALALAEPTCVTHKSATVIDNFVVSRSLAEQIGAAARALLYLLRPHRPAGINKSSRTPSWCQC